MNYSETLEYLYNSTPVFERVGASAYKEGLENTIALDDYFHNPHRNYRCIHVAGTNGKGSTSHTLAAILQAAGYRVGLYTSPHIVDFAERIRVDGKMIDHDYVVDFVEKHRNFFEPLHPSFFEIITAMAFRYFADMNVDIAVIEVGLGGRLDCTNIITPILSVITNISFDHTGFLGDTLAKIAGEKAGIIKPGVPVVVGEVVDETLPVFVETARRNGSPITIVDQQDDSVDKYLPMMQLKGKYQKRNLHTILAAVEALKCQYVIPSDFRADRFVTEGLSHVCEMTGLRGRWETIAESPLTVCDTGHNVAGWEWLAPQISEQYALCLSRCGVGESCALRIVFGMVDDKDIDRVMELLPHEAVYYFCKASTHRAIPVDKVVEKAHQHGLDGSAFTSVAEAYEAAQKESAPNDFVFIGGSSYVVADLLSR